MEKEVKDNGCIVVQGDLEINIPPSTIILIRLLNLPWIVPFFILSSIAFACSKYIVAIAYSLPRSAIDELVVMKPVSLLIPVAVGMICCYCIYRAAEMLSPAFMGVVMVEALTIYFALKDSTLSTNEIYYNVLFMVCFIEGYLLEWWAIFARSKVEELYTREIKKQASESFEKELASEVERLCREQEQSNS